MAWAYIQLRDYDEAERQADRAAALRPTLHVLAHRAACRGYYRGDRERTRRELEEVRRRFPPETWTYGDCLTLYGMYLKLSDPRTTASICDEYLRVVPGAAQVHVLRGDALMSSGDQPAAQAAYTRALELKPDYWFVYNNRAWSYSRAGDQEKALADIERFIQSPSLRPRDGRATPDQLAKLAEAIAGRGTFLRRAGRHAEVKRSDREALAIRLKIEGDGLTEGITVASSWDLHVHYGSLANLVGSLCQPDEAAPIFRVIRRDPPRQANPKAVAAQGDLYHVLALLLARTDAVGEQEESWRRAIALHEKASAAGEALPEWKFRLAFGHLRLADMLRSSGRADEAAEPLREAERAMRRCREPYEGALARDPDDPKACNNLAWSLVVFPPSRADADRAVQLARKAVERAPDAGESWNTLGVAEYRAGAWDRAIAALTRSTELTSGGLPADWFFLSLAHGQQGDEVAARSWYDKAVTGMDENHRHDAELLLFRSEAAEGHRDRAAAAR